MKSFRAFYLSESSRHELPSQAEVAAYLKKEFPEVPLWKSMDVDYSRYGLMSDNPDLTVKNILTAVTPTKKVFEYAEKNNFDLIISHHPPEYTKRLPMSIISFHLPMDFGGRKTNQNKYFAFKMGLKNIKYIGDSYVCGTLPVTMSIDNLLRHMENRGYKIPDKQRHLYKKNNKMISSVVFVSGLGGEIENFDPDMYPTFEGVEADALITGQVDYIPVAWRNQFDFIIELGHTASEKPLFKWIANKIKNRWSDVVVEKAPVEIDLWGDENRTHVDLPV
jgi:putative NIF3 family GTP cyclohydrolase 1 type 2